LYTLIKSFARKLEAGIISNSLQLLSQDILILENNSQYYLDFVWAESPGFYLRLNQVGKKKEDP
jgi:hypothetical protein